jgi:hypothetical protein
MLHLAFDVSFRDRAAEEGIPCVHHQANTPKTEHEPGPEEAPWDRGTARTGSSRTHGRRARGWGGSMMTAPNIPLAMCTSAGVVPQWYMKIPAYCVDRHHHRSPVDDAAHAAHKTVALQSVERLGARHLNHQCRSWVRHRDPLGVGGRGTEDGTLPPRSPEYFDPIIRSSGRGVLAEPPPARNASLPRRAAVSSLVPSQRGRSQPAPAGGSCATRGD